MDVSSQLYKFSFVLDISLRYISMVTLNLDENISVDGREGIFFAGGRYLTNLEITSLVTMMIMIYMIKMIKMIKMLMMIMIIMILMMIMIIRTMMMILILMIVMIRVDDNISPTRRSPPWWSWTGHDDEDNVYTIIWNKKNNQNNDNEDVDDGDEYWWLYLNHLEISRTSSSEEEERWWRSLSLLMTFGNYVFPRPWRALSSSPSLPSPWSTTFLSSSRWSSIADSATSTTIFWYRQIFFLKICNDTT